MGAQASYPEDARLESSTGRSDEEAIFWRTFDPPNRELITETESHAFHAYLQDWYTLINPLLRDEVVVETGVQRKRALGCGRTIVRWFLRHFNDYPSRERLRTALGKDEISLYRGVTRDPRRFRVGEEYTNRALVSTSWDRETAESFVKGEDAE